MQFSEEEIVQLQKERDQKLEEATKSVQQLANGSSAAGIAPTSTAVPTGKTQTATASPTVNENNEVIQPNVEYSPREGSEVSTYKSIRIEYFLKLLYFKFTALNFS